MLAFAKMNGLGNRILVVDARGTAERVSAAAARRLADGETAFDQIMEISDTTHPERDHRIRILNRDGSEAGACGNGMRCVMEALHAETGAERLVFEGPEGRLVARHDGGGAISVLMGRPRLDWDQIPTADEFFDTTGIELQIGPIDDPVLHTPAVCNMGNPHAVFFVDDDPWGYDLDRFGPLLENHPMFPDRANISLARVTGPDELEIRTWERGAGLTLACGSAACAAAVSAARKELTGRTVTVAVPGSRDTGEKLVIEWRADGDVVMTGPAAWEWGGMLDGETGEWRRDEEAA